MRTPPPTDAPSRVFSVLLTSLLLRGCGGGPWLEVVVMACGVFMLGSLVASWLARTALRLSWRALRASPARETAAVRLGSEYGAAAHRWAGCAVLLWLWVILG